MTRVAQVAAVALVAAAVMLSAAASPGGSRTAQREHAGVPRQSPIASIQDAALVSSRRPEERLRLMAGLGARLVRVDLLWDTVARRRPRDPRDPRDPAYRWARYDRIVAAARQAGVEILFTVWGTPAWAADPDVAPTRRFPARAARPRDPADFGRFGAAVAARYAPRGVRRLEAWNEPNLPLFLRPQYERGGGRWVPTSPRVYAAMLSSFYREVKAVDRRMVVGGGVTAPAGDQCPSSCPDEPDDRITPIAFLRALAAPGLRPPMDVYTHHPYPLTRPRSTSFAGASFTDLYNLDRLQDLLDTTYLRGRPLWLTEFGFSTRPVAEYRFAVGERDQAQYLADAYARVRANPRVQVLTWYLLQDHPSWASGLLDERGRRKPAAAAFRLPLGAVPAGPDAHTRTLVGQVRVAGGATRVALERGRSGRWQRVALMRTSADGSFALDVPARTSDLYRARWSGRERGGRRGSAVSPILRIN
jgi:hypothetical protein